MNANRSAAGPGRPPATHPGDTQRSPARGRILYPVASSPAWFEIRGGRRVQRAVVPHPWSLSAVPQSGAMLLSLPALPPCKAPSCTPGPTVPQSPGTLSPPEIVARSPSTSSAL